MNILGKNNKSLIRRGANQGFTKIEFSANGKNYEALRKINSKGDTYCTILRRMLMGKLTTIAEGETKTIPRINDERS